MCGVWCGVVWCGVVWCVCGVMWFKSESGWSGMECVCVVWCDVCESEGEWSGVEWSGVSGIEWGGVG